MDMHAAVLNGGPNYRAGTWTSTISRDDTLPDHNICSHQAADHHVHTDEYKLSVPLSHGRSWGAAWQSLSSIAEKRE